MNLFKGITKLGFTLAMGVSFAVMALTDSGIVIKNQAGATYLDSANISRSTTSNLVETLVNPVVAFTLENSQTKRGAPEGIVTFHHVLTNTGNSTDSFQLAINQLGSGISAVTIYSDANQDGLLDPGTAPISSGSFVGPLAPGESYEFVIEAAVSPTVILNSSQALTISATSQKANSGTALANGAISTITNTDTIDVTDLPIIEITKSLNSNSGPSPSGPYTVTFTYTNKGMTDMDPTATNGIKLTDELPEGMRFNGGVSWSFSNTNITASGTTSGDSQSVGDQDIAFSTCIAPSASCLVKDKIEFIMDGLPQGGSAKITFEVNIEQGLLATTLYNQGIYGYDENNNGVVESSENNSTNTNRVPFQIVADYSVLANNGGCDLGTDNNCDGLDDTNHEIVDLASISQGERARFVNYIWNTGNDTDIFNITLEGSTFPAGTSFFFYESDGITPLLDTDNDGKPDTGRIPAAGETCPDYLVTDSTNGLCANKVVLVATLPITALGGPYQVTKRATSSKDTSVSNTVIDRLSSVTQNTVDLTNNYPSQTLTTAEENCNEVADGCGFGEGAETDPVTINQAAPGQTTRFTLYATNTSNTADSYLLEYSGSDFAAGNLPAGWSVSFKNTDETLISSIPVVAPYQSVLFYADVTVPENASLESQSIYFKVISSSTGAFDIKHDAVSVSQSTCLIFEPANASGSVATGGVAIYEHRVVNNNVGSFDNLVFNVENSATGFSAVLYADTDGSDTFNPPDDEVLTSIATLAGQSEFSFFVKVLAPSNAAENTVNLTTITLALPCGTIEAVDTTTVSNTNMKIVKEQALDALCDGTPDVAGFVTTPFAVAPGQCVIYRLTTENTGINQAHNVFIQDATPAYTSFLVIGGTIPTLSKGSINPILDGDTGSIIGNVGTMAPGEIETLIFGVRIDD